MSFLIADFSGHALVRLGHAGSTAATRTQGDETAERVSLMDSSPGRALATQSVIVEPGPHGARVFAPVTNRGEAIGVLDLLLPEPPDEQVLAEVAFAAHALAYVIIANRRFTDLFEWGQRSVPLSLAAEIQHRLLPGAYTCEAGQFTLAGWLEPAGNVGGDTFDFALERGMLHFSLTDAMGHEVNAALLATLMVGGLRNARRAGVGLAEQARLASDGLADNAPQGGFVTGQVGRIDLRTRTATIVNAGHPLPLRLRDGRVARVELHADPPFGTIRGRGHGRGRRGRCTRARPSSTSPRPSSRRPVASSSTTRPRCASTGTVDRRATGRPTPGPTAEAEAGGGESPPPPSTASAGVRGRLLHVLLRAGGELLAVLAALLLDRVACALGRFLGDLAGRARAPPGRSPWPWP